MKAAAAGFALLLLSYLIPYTLLRGSSDWSLYAFWTAAGLASLALAWSGTRGWGVK